MEVFEYLAYLILAIISLRFLYLIFTNNNGLPRNWPLVGMTPTLLVHFNHVVDKVSELLEKSNGTLQYKGIWFTNTSFLATANPQNVFYLMNTNYAAYPKGSEWRKQFDVFGEALLNSDGEEWKRQRRIFHAFLNHPQFHHSLSRILRQRLEQGLIQMLDHFSKQELVVDLQDLLVRYASDIGWKIATGSNPNFLSIEFPKNQFSQAMNDVWEAAFYRAILPDTLWKLQSWLQVGLEKRRCDAWKYFDHVLAQHIVMQRQKATEVVAMNEDDHEGINFNFLNCYLTGHKVTGPTPKDSLIRDNIIHLLLANNDTYSTTLGWFFYLLSQNPNVVPKIREEIERNLSMKKVGEFQVPASFDELNKLLYLQAALSETLRLYPPNPFEVRASTQRDTLPSGHRVNPQSVIIIAIHAMGKMTWLWGEDCHEFKPERWITKAGKLKREAPSKFFAFLSGPRICPGKELSFFLMKATASTIIHNFDVHVIEGQDMTPKNSVFLHMKHGLKVRIKKKYES